MLQNYLEKQNSSTLGVRCCYEYHKPFFIESYISISQMKNSHTIGEEKLYNIKGDTRKQTGIAKEIDVG